MPVDPHPVYIQRDSEGDIKGVSINGEIVPGKLAMKGGDSVEVYISHFATCTDAATHRRG
jgi:hypothetical protein